MMLQIYASLASEKVMVISIVLNHRPSHTMFFEGGGGLALCLASVRPRWWSVTQSLVKWSIAIALEAPPI